MPSPEDTPASAASAASEGSPDSAGGPFKLPRRRSSSGDAPKDELARVELGDGLYVAGSPGSGAVGACLSEPAAGAHCSAAGSHSSPVGYWSRWTSTGGSPTLKTQATITEHEEASAETAAELDDWLMEHEHSRPSPSKMMLSRSLDGTHTRAASVPTPSSRAVAIARGARETMGVIGQAVSAAAAAATASRYGKETPHVTSPDNASAEAATGAAAASLSQMTSPPATPSSISQAMLQAKSAMSSLRQREKSASTRFGSAPASAPASVSAPMGGLHPPPTPLVAPLEEAPGSPIVAPLDALEADLMVQPPSPSQLPVELSPSREGASHVQQEARDESEVQMMRQESKCSGRRGSSAPPDPDRWQSSPMPSPPQTIVSPQMPLSPSRGREGGFHREQRGLDGDTPAEDPPVKAGQAAWTANAPSRRTRPTRSREEEAPSASPGSEGYRTAGKASSRSPPRGGEDARSERRGLESEAPSGSFSTLDSLAHPGSSMTLPCVILQAAPDPAAGDRVSTCAPAAGATPEHSSDEKDGGTGGQELRSDGEEEDGRLAALVATEPAALHALLVPRARSSSAATSAWGSFSDVTIHPTASFAGSMAAGNNLASFAGSMASETDATASGSRAQSHTLTGIGGSVVAPQEKALGHVL